MPENEAGFQAITNTSKVWKIATAAVDTAAPTPADIGVLIDWDTEANWTELPFKLTEDDFTFNAVDGTPINVKAPEDIQQAAVVYQNTPGVIDRVEFTSYEIGSKVLGEVSNYETSTNVYTPTDTLASIAVVIEWAGAGFMFIPNCVPVANGWGGGKATLGTVPVYLDINAATDLAAGYSFNQNV